MAPRWPLAALGLFTLVALGPSSAAGEEDEAWLEGLDDDDEETDRYSKLTENVNDVDFDKMQGSLAELKAMMSGDGVNDPEVRKKFQQMQKQFAEMGMDTSGPGLDLPDTDLYTACMAMSTRTAGFQTAPTAAALRKMSEGFLEPAEAAETLVWRLVGICVLELTKEHAADFTAGRISDLPKAYVAAAQRPDAVERVRNLPEHRWKDFEMMSKALVEQMEKTGVPILEPVSGGSASNMGLLLMIPLLGVFGVLAKKVVDMTKESDTKKDKKLKKKGSKSK